MYPNLRNCGVSKTVETTQPREGPATWCSRPCGRSHSKFQLVRGRHGGVLSGVIFMRIVGADGLRPLAQRRKWALIDDARRPRHREDAYILDRELELQPLALIVGVACKPRIGSPQAV